MAPLLLILALTRVETEDLASVFSTLNPVYFMAAVALSLLMQFAFCIRTKFLLGEQQMSSGLRNLFAISLASSFYNLMLPSILSGGVIRWYRISCMDGKRVQTLSVILFERIYDNVSWIIMIMGSLVFSYINGGVSAPVMSGGIAATGALLMVPVFMAYLVRSKRADDVWFAYLPNIFAMKARDFIMTLRNHTGSIRHIALMLLFTVALHLAYQFAIYVTAGSIVPSMGFDTFLLINLAIVILCQLPVTIAGIGLNEIIFGTFLPTHNASAGQGVMLGLFISAIYTAISLIGGVIEMSSRGSFRKKVTDSR